MKKEIYKHFNKGMMLLVLFLGCFIFNPHLASSDPIFNGIQNSGKSSENLLQQEIEVSGTVTDAQTGDPLPGVNIVVQGTTTGTTTDMDGNYTLEAPEDATLVFSFVGYQEVTIGIEGQKQIDVEMQQAVTELEEVVAIGYGTVRKEDATGSIKKIQGEEFQDQSMTQVGEMFSGNTVAGFHADQATGAEGGSSGLEVRGRTSLTAASDPLLVVDGVIYSGDMSSINPYDIESMDVLKGPSAAAIYGTRAAAGVIIINTKKGEGKPTVHFSSKVGMAQVTNPNDVGPLGPEEYTDFRRDLFNLRSPQETGYYHNPNELPEGITQDEWLNYSDNPADDPIREWLGRLNFYPKEMEAYLEGHTVDWYDKLMQNGLRQNYNLSVDGSSEAFSYYWSVGYTNNEGIRFGDAYETIRSKLNLDVEVADFLNIGMNTQFSNRDNSAVEAGGIFDQSPYSWMWENGEEGTKLDWSPNGYQFTTNPFVNAYNQKRKAETNNIFSSMYAQFQLPFGFSYEVTYSPRFTFADTYNFFPSSSTIVGARSYTDGYGNRTNYKEYKWQVDNIIKWNKEFGIHDFDFTFLYNAEKYQSWWSQQEGEQFMPNENLGYNNLEMAMRKDLSNNDAYETGDALMARLNYSLDGKYLFTFSFRRDGYSAFGKEHPRANFPSGAFAWRISEENFYDIDFLNELKLRLSYGVNGNRDIGRYVALAQLESNLYSDGSELLGGVYTNTIANPELRWERTKAFNVGLTYGFLENRITGDIDVYHMSTEDLLMARSLPAITGFSNIYTNLGEIQNKGLELSINSVNLNSPNFTWESGLSFSLNRNEVVSLYGGGKNDIANEWFIGKSLNRIWDYKIEGVWQVDEKEEADEYDLRPGDYKVEDVNGDGVYTELQDKQFLGWEKPRYRISLRNEFNIQNFSVSMLIRSNLGYDGADNQFKHPGMRGYDRHGTRSVPYWTPDNPSNKYGSLAPRNVFGGNYNIYFDRSFVRIQNFSMGYNFSNLQGLNLQNLRLYGSVRNLALLYNPEWMHWDPESGYSPMPRIFTLGVDISF